MNRLKRKFAKIQARSGKKQNSAVDLMRPTRRATPSATDESPVPRLNPQW